jgi:hypothetical protein
MALTTKSFRKQPQEPVEEKKEPTPRKVIEMPVTQELVVLKNGKKTSHLRRYVDSNGLYAWKEVEE